jgi:hypothetical protein
VSFCFLATSDEQSGKGTWATNVRPAFLAHSKTRRYANERSGAAQTSVDTAIGNSNHVSMEWFKRNQVEEAVSRIFERGLSEPSVELRTKLRRLLDTDRNLRRNRRSSDPEKANYRSASLRQISLFGSSVRILTMEASAGPK